MMTKILITTVETVKLKKNVVIKNVYNTLEKKTLITQRKIKL